MNPDLAHTVQQLSRYLRHHPKACDTAEGIARWWLSSARAPVPLALVEAALDHLLALDLVQARRAADGRVRYRRNPADTTLDARLDALARDPLTLPAAAPPPAARPPRMH